MQDSDCGTIYLVGRVGQGGSMGGGVEKRSVLSGYGYKHSCLLMGSI